jgi:hypothetical protein
MPVWLGLVWSVCRAVLANFFYFPVSSTTSTSPSSTETLCNKRKTSSVSVTISHTPPHHFVMPLGFGLVLGWLCLVVSFILLSQLSSPQHQES